MLNSTTNRNNWNTDISKFLPGNFFKDWNNYLKNLISEVPGAAMLCIGTELNHFDTAFRKEWEDLILSIRSVYNKPITYDAIFNRWKSTPDVNDVVFWDLMDYIGVSLYVPVTSDDSASVDEIASYWNGDYSKGQQIGNIGSVIDYLKNISSRYNKKIIAIEGGYQSVNTGLINVNSSPSNTKVVNYDLQTRGLDAYLTVLKSSQGKLNEMDNWLAGVSLWQVTPRNMTISGLASIYHTQEFTTYNKPAAAVIKRHYIKS